MIRKIEKLMAKHHITWRLVLAVVAGIIFSKLLTMLTHFLLYKAGVLTAPDEPMFDRNNLFIVLVFHSLFSIAAACLTAHIARERAGHAVFILGTKEAIMWIIGTLLLWKHSPPWFNVTKALLGLPLSILGGKIYGWLNNKKVKVKAKA